MLLQLLLVVIVIFIPQTVTVFLDKPVVLDLDKVEMPAPDMQAPSDNQGSLDDLMKQLPSSEPTASSPR